MYNGVGLPTARASGTSGYVQRNLANVYVKKVKGQYNNEEDIKRLEASLTKEPNREILNHDRKRQVELKCMELADLMEDQSYSQEDIDAKVNEYRTLLTKKLAEGGADADDEFTPLDEFGRPAAKETHRRAQLQLEKNKNLKQAFGLDPNYVDGSSLERIRTKHKGLAAAVPTSEQEQTDQAGWKERYQHEERKPDTPADTKPDEKPDLKPDPKQIAQTDDQKAAQSSSDSSSDSDSDSDSSSDSSDSSDSAEDSPAKKPPSKPVEPAPRPKSPQNDSRRRESPQQRGGRSPSNRSPVQRKRARHDSGERSRSPEAARHARRCRVSPEASRGNRRRSPDREHSDSHRRSERRERDAHRESERRDDRRSDKSAGRRR